MGNSKRFLCKMLFLINLWDFAETKWGRRACCLESGTWCYHKTRVAKLAGYEIRLGQALPATLLRHLGPFRFPFKQRGLRQPATKPLSYLTRDTSAAVLVPFGGGARTADCCWHPHIRRCLRRVTPAAFHLWVRHPDAVAVCNHFVDVNREICGVAK